MPPAPAKRSITVGRLSTTDSFVRFDIVLSLRSLEDGAMGAGAEVALLDARVDRRLPPEYDRNIEKPAAHHVGAGLSPRSS